MNINKPDILFINSENFNPYFNMAVDEYFLNLTENNKINGYLRLYKWIPAAISIGSFFNTKFLNKKNIHNDNLIIVRRITGGKALLHKNDLTYSITLKKGIYNLFTKKDYYLFLAEILKNALKMLGIKAKVNTKLKDKISSPDCFNTLSQYELSADNGNKLIGSAQKIEKKSMLQHGSFLNNYNPVEIQKYLNNTFKYKSNHKSLISLNNYENYFKKAFIKYFNLIEYNLSNKDLKSINLLMKNKYLNNEWTYRR